MFSTLIIWTYIFIVSYITGFAFITLLKGREEKAVSPDSSFMAGIAFLIFYSQVFSLFSGVGLMANIILVILCGILVLIFFKKIMRNLQSMWSLLSVKRLIVYFFIIMIIAYVSTRGHFHYDTSLYHAQSIRWIEEYGVVKGLGNLHNRFAYNSASFCLSALFSFAFLKLQSFHCVPGFLACVLCLFCAEMFFRKRERRIYLSDLARVVGLYYITTVYRELISPASDYFTMILVFYIIIKWLDLLERKEESYPPYGLLCLLGVTVMAVKLSAALILLLTIKPGVMMIREKKGKQIALFLGLGMLTIAPYFIRNVLISGWLVYPYTGIDLFDVEWKMPKGIADYDYKEIQVWGRTLRDVNKYDWPITEWFGSWFGYQNNVDKVFIVGALSSVTVMGVYMIYIFVKRRWKELDWLLLAATILLSFLFWLKSAPLIRYGCVYVWLAPVMIYGHVILEHVKRELVYRVSIPAICILGCYKAFMLGMEIQKDFKIKHFIIPRDYDNYETMSYEIEGYTFYYPKEGDRTGYDPFPSAPRPAQIVFRGDSLKEGFNSTEKEE